MQTHQAVAFAQNEFDLETAAQTSDMNKIVAKLKNVCTIIYPDSAEFQKKFQEECKKCIID